MAHTAPGCHQEKLFLGHLTHRSVKDRFNVSNVILSDSSASLNSSLWTYLLWQCSSKSMMKVCQAFSLLSVSRAVGMRAKHNVITSRASQHTCSSSPSGSFAAFV